MDHLETMKLCIVHFHRYQPESITLLQVKTYVECGGQMPKNENCYAPTSRNGISRILTPSFVQNRNKPKWVKNTQLCMQAT